MNIREKFISFLSLFKLPFLLSKFGFEERGAVEANESFCLLRFSSYLNGIFQWLTPERVSYFQLSLRLSWNVREIDFSNDDDTGSKKKKKRK